VVDFGIHEYVFECVQISVCVRASLMSLTEILQRTHTLNAVVRVIYSFVHQHDSQDSKKRRKHARGHPPLRVTQTVKETRTFHKVAFLLFQVLLSEIWE